MGTIVPGGIIMANLLKNDYFHGNHGSLGTETYVKNVFLDGSMGILYVNLYIENILYETIQINLNPAKCYSEILHLPLIEQN